MIEALLRFSERAPSADAARAVEIARRMADWQVVNTERPSEPCAGKVFQIWIDHGKAPQGASVRYEIRP